MERETVNGPIRLRESGVGVTAGGAVLAWSSLLVQPLLSATIVVLVAVAWAIIKPPWGRSSLVAIGIALVGIIGLIEASPIGLGIDHLVLGFFAMAFGMLDIIVGLTISRWRRRS